MKKTKLTTLFLCLLSFLLVFCSCKNDELQITSTDPTVETTCEELTFTFKVVSPDGTEFIKEISTAEKTVGAALLSQGLISGDMGDYGLYVKTVNGITLEYDVDGSYWAFYINGEYAAVGVDSVNIVSGETYEFRAEK